MIRIPYAGTVKLELVTAQAGASVVAFYSDDSGVVYPGGIQPTSIVSATTTTICDTPAADTVRDVDYLNVKNTYAGPHTMTLQMDVGGTTHPLPTFTLQQDESFNYTHGSGCRVMTAAGVIKSGAAAAVDISNTPAGNIAATTVQAAIDELDDEKVGYGGGFNNLCTVGGTANAITLTPPIAITSYASNIGIEYSFVATATNTTAATIAISGLAALNLTMGVVALPIGAIVSGRRYRAVVESATSIRVAPYDAASVDGDTVNGQLLYTTGLTDNTATLALADALFVKSQIAKGTNALMMAQAVAMTAATSGSNGITVADAAVLDCGTYGFTLIWNGALPDYTPADTVWMTRKRSTTNGFGFGVIATGYVRITLNLFSYDSTATLASLGVSDGSYVEVGVSITRETAAAAGSIIFVVNGVQLGAAVAITASAPTTADNAEALYVLGTSATRTAGICRSAHLYNRALTTSGLLAHYLNGVGESDKWGSVTPTYTSDFSAGVDGWALYAGSTVAGNVDAIGGLDDWLEMTAGATNPSCRRTSSTSPILNPYKRSRITVTYYIPVTSTVTSVQFNTQTLVTGNLYSATAVKGAATTITFDALESEGLYGMNFRVLGATVGDKAYIRGITSTPIGSVLALESSGIQPNQWHDASTNDQHATYPTAGASLTQWKEAGLYHWTVAITADTTLTSIVPAGYELEKILFNNFTAGAVSVRLGTTASGTEIFGLTALNTSATFGGYLTISVNQGFSKTAAQTLYLSSTDWTGGGTPPSLTFTMYFRRIT